MERTGKYEKFPVLKAGDLVVCGKHTAYIVTGKGGYGLSESSDPTVPAILTGFVDNMEHLFNGLHIIELSQYIPEAVFRPREELPITTSSITTAMRNWRSVSIDNTERYERIWSIDDDNVKELTVDEVSKLLGYKVKIIG